MEAGKDQVALGDSEKIINKLREFNDTFGMIEEHLCNISKSLQKLSRCVGYVPPTPHQKEGYHILRIVRKR